MQVGWGTASEQHSAYFEVQRSLDGSTFTTIAKVAANGTTTQAHAYTSLDQAAPATQLYYRLRQVDTDGTNTFSPVVTLGATEAATTLALYPNPAHSQLTIAAAAGQQVQIIDLAGRVLQTTTLPASGNLSVELLPAGTYLLRAPVSGQQRVLRFTKE
ncbi:MAG: T9SS type A sorting domain-containing protein [Cytophagaceae bacterium]|nr:MAG: T9SS type A sorting domain-containing protein [Cytophagaceae bacterium]